MLPNRSKRYASDEGRIRRLPLVTPIELALVALAVLALLILIFPRQTLLKQLINEGANDEISISYMENMVRHGGGNLELRLLLAKTKIGHIDQAELDRLLLPVERDGTPAQQATAKLLRFQVELADKSIPSNDVLAALRDLQNYALSATDLIYLANSAVKLNQSALAWRFFRRARALAPGRYERWPTEAAARSLGSGHYRTGADLYFLARQEAHNRARARHLFHAGVAALMADSLFADAMRDAQRYLGDLDHDTTTVRYLVATARAAGYPRLAARYARILVGLPPAPEEDHAAEAPQ